MVKLIEIPLLHPLQEDDRPLLSFLLDMQGVWKGMKHYCDECKRPISECGSLQRVQSTEVRNYRINRYQTVKKRVRITRMLCKECKAKKKSRPKNINRIPTMNPEERY